MDLTADQIHQLATPAKLGYVTALTEAGVLDQFEINTGLRVAHFLAQTLHESGGFTILTESLFYTHASRLMVVWPSRFPTPESAQSYVRNPEALANLVYSGRMGNVQAGDGFRFIGRGLLQITGRESYERAGKVLGIDLAGNPDLAFSPTYALRVAAAEWQWSLCNEAADEDDIVKVTRLVNGGEIGLDERRVRLAAVKDLLGLD